MQQPDPTPDSRPLAEFPTGELVYKKGAAEFLGISLKTLDRYVKAGTLRHWKNSINGRIYYDKQDLLKLLGSRLPQSRQVVVYCRAAGIPDQGAAGVSSRTRLQAQQDRVLQYCTAAGIRVDQVIAEVGKAGSLVGRSGLDKIFDLVLRKQVSMVIVETPDRLARFAGAEILERFLTWHGVELHVIQKTLYQEEYREELKEDLSYLIMGSQALLGGQPVAPQ
ncbi:COG2452 Predicted site-specific integrase-resolvase [uncultured Caudovirales phage]|uniref:COG2452 Predicted site-specific integrase-resolvase n=1 Tax=uncultured Caudovirales phage TaxID=2100421 RepID=A0A6J5SUS4_9CAUD|nr:COG2452 Predicted site-specific integrase-resolvase [uncultured Caudovirales phage]